MVSFHFVLDSLENFLLTFYEVGIFYEVLFMLILGLYVLLIYLEFVFLGKRGFENGPWKEIGDDGFAAEERMAFYLGNARSHLRFGLKDQS